jgi:hypothetical protein
MLFSSGSQPIVIYVITVQTHAKLSFDKEIQLLYFATQPRHHY